MCIDMIVSEREDLEFNDKRVFYTEIEDVLNASEITISQYNWLIVDYECNYYPNNEWENERHDYIWVSGNELSAILSSNEQLQFIWGVIVAYEHDVEFEDVRAKDLPVIDISKFDRENLEMQSELGILEIVAADSSMFSMISKKVEYIENLRMNIKGFGSGIKVGTNDNY
jgi:hypothetical protein